MNTNTLFSDAQLNGLRTEYAGIQTIDPASSTYARVIGLLDVMNVATLKQIVAARIKFLSPLANIRVLRKTGAIK